MTTNRSPTRVDAGIGRRVRARRLEVGMSQERLAELLGVTFQQVQKMEKGVNRIAASRLWDIAVSLEVPVAFFYPEHAWKGPAQHGAAEKPLRVSEQLLAADRGVSWAKVYVDAPEKIQPALLASAQATAKALAETLKR